jgi:mitochondrial distribution and morphology protein 10
VYSPALLDFPTPRGLKLTLSSLATPNFATGYQLESLRRLDGSISYLYSSVPLQARLIPGSDVIPLPVLLRSYRQLTPLRHDGALPWPKSAYSPAASMLYGRLYLPDSLLEALVVKRFTSALQVQLSAVSQRTLRNGGTLLGLAQYDVGRYSMESLASSDGGLLGLRGVYNFGGDSEEATHQGAQPGSEESHNTEREKIYGRFSTGGEIYYGTLNKSGGMSIGARFATLPDHKGTPLTATVLLNPLMGVISASYAVVAGKRCSLATRMSFNVYSYESDWTIGMELWRKAFNLNVLEDTESFVGGDKTKRKGRSFEARLEWRLDDPEPTTPPPSVLPLLTGETGGSSEEEYAGVLKARLDQSLRIGLLWEGRVKSLLFSLGSGIDLRKPDSPFRTVGLEIQFSS